MEVKNWTLEKPQASVYRCGDCSKVYQSYSSFTRHKNVHSGVKYPCPRCPAIFAAKNYLTQHLKRSKSCMLGKSVTEDKKTKKTCPKCQKEFTNLASHKQRCFLPEEEKPKKPLQCSSCNTRFANLLAMHRHTCKHLDVAYEIFLQEGQDVFDLDLGEVEQEQQEVQHEMQQQVTEQPEFNIVMEWDKQALQFSWENVAEEVQLDIKEEADKDVVPLLHMSCDIKEESVNDLENNVVQDPLLHMPRDIETANDADVQDPLQELLKCCAEYNERLVNILNCYQ